VATDAIGTAVEFTLSTLSSLPSKTALRQSAAGRTTIAGVPWWRLENQLFECDHHIISVPAVIASIRSGRINRRYSHLAIAINVFTTPWILRY
jgi:hypothetical protein